MRRQRSGMTLIEIMIALFVLAIMAMLTAMTLDGALKSRDALAFNDKVQQSARVALSTISRELQLAYMTFNLTAVNTYRTVFVGKNTDPVDTLWFATLSHHRLYRNTRESDQTEITIWAEEDPYGDHMVLMHREAPRIDHEPGEDGVIYPLAYNVKEFVVRYLDPESCVWKDDWDSMGSEQTNRLPRAAQIVLIVVGPDPDDDEEEVDHTFATTVVLQYAKRARCQLFTGGEDEETPQGQDLTGLNR